jgi:23S rRNA (cytosine1962-C5)-methyltransferase
VYRERVTSAPPGLEAGEVVDLVDGRGEFVGRAIADPTSPIVARVVTRSAGERPDGAWLGRKLAAAFALRRALLDRAQTDAYRLAYGEGDGVPGLVIDRYADVAVVRADGAGAAAWVEREREAVWAALAAEGVRAAALREVERPAVDAPKARPWAGGEVPAVVTVREHGMRMEVDLARGQKTGAFLDQRENRRRVRALAAGRRVLNLFSYAGGFSLAARLGGAAHVTSVDRAAGGHASAQRSYRLNGLDPGGDAFVTGDAFAFLEAAAARGERWGLVVSDPPSFAPSERAKARALGAYRALHAACARVLEPGGLFCAASCSSHVSAEEFAQTLDGRALGPAWRLCEQRGLPADHPTTPAWREGRYLKFVLLAGPLPMRVLLVSANRETLPSPVVPLGVLAVAGALRDAHEVRVLDLCFEADPAGAVGRAAAAFRPEVVGLGIRNLHTNAYDGTDALLGEYGALVAAVRAATGAPLVLGGSGFSLRPEGLLARYGAEHGVAGEGERAMRGIVDALARGERPARLVRAAPAPLGPGGVVALARRPGEGGGGAGAHEPGRRGDDLDLLPPPARDLVDPRYYELDGTDNVQTKRGCAFQCAYCDYPDLEGRKVRARDPEAVADEVLARSRVPGVDYVFFVDSVFNVPRSHALAVCRALERRGAPLPWVCYGSPAAFDDELVAAMARARCAGVEIGSDGGTEASLARLRKPFGLAHVRRARELFLAHGLLDCHTFVLGAFDESPAEVDEALAFVDELDPDVATFVVFMEDREAMSPHRARHREAILARLAEAAPKRPGWVVPELGIRFDERLNAALRRAGRRGPSWLHLARARRAAAARRRA